MSATEDYAEALKLPAQFIGATADGNEAWMRGRVMFVIPGIPDRASPRLKHALTIRRDASLNSVCECGATACIKSDGIYLEHEDACPACDTNLI